MIELLIKFCQLLHESVYLDPVGILCAVVEAVTNIRWRSKAHIPEDLFQAVRKKVLRYSFASPWLRRIFEMVPTVDALRVHRLIHFDRFPC